MVGLAARGEITTHQNHYLLHLLFPSRTLSRKISKVFWSVDTNFTVLIHYFTAFGIKPFLMEKSQKIKKELLDSLDAVHINTLLIYTFCVRNLLTLFKGKLLNALCFLQLVC